MKKHIKHEPTTVKYIGQLVYAENGEETDLLGLLAGDLRPRVEILAELVNDAMWKYGDYLSVSYYVSDVFTDNPQAEFLKQLYGEGDAEYGMHYSDLTGYLWTDEKLNVGGHDLIQELKTKLGKYLYMTIKFSREPK